MTLFALPRPAVLIRCIIWLHFFNAVFVNKDPFPVFGDPNTKKSRIDVLASRAGFRSHSFNTHDETYPRWLLHRKRPTTKPRLVRCLVLRPAVRFRQSLNDEGFRFFRMSLMTWPGSIPNCSRMASKVVRSSQAIWIMRSVWASV